MDPGGGRARPPRRRVDGVLLLDKPAGLSSNAALQRAKRAFAADKAGHTGTLDPLATGLLPLCFGDATKFAQAVLDAPKEYVATVRFGAATTTGDAEGETVRTCDVAFARAELAAALHAFRRPASSRRRPRSRRSSSRGATITSTRAPASTFPASPVRSRSGRSSSSTGRRRSPFCASPAARAPTCACWPRTSPARLAACAHLAALRRTVSGPFALGRRRDARGTRGHGHRCARRVAAARRTRRFPGSPGSTWTRRPRRTSWPGAWAARRPKCPDDAAATVRRGGFWDWSKRAPANCARCASRARRGTP